MKLLIATPAYGGVVTCQYLHGLIKTLALLRDDGHQVHLHMLEAESLISRGRNTAATYAITKGFDKLLFIDADMIFTYEKVKMLLESKELIVGGTYPLKNFPLCLNFNPLSHQDDLFGQDRQQSNYLNWVSKYADANGEAVVRHVPTGFLLIDCAVLAKLTYTVPYYQTFQPETKEKQLWYEFFPVGVRDREYESEDWAFCRLATEQGFRVVLQTRAVCGHTGVMHYGLGQHVIVGQPPLIPRN